MKRAAILLVFVAGIAFAAGTTIELSEADVATCNKECGCRLITERALDTLTAEIVRLQRAIVAMRKEQCT